MYSARNCYPSSQSLEDIFPGCTSSVDCWLLPDYDIHPCSRMKIGLLRRVLETFEEDKVTEYRQLAMASKAGSDYTMIIRGHV